MARHAAMEFGLVGVLGLAVVGSTFAISQSSNEYSFLDELIEVKTIINQRYHAKPDEQKLLDGAIKGMVDALDDPYTEYVPASDAQEFNKGLTGEYVGIGAQIEKKDGWLTIVSPLEDSPALRAGIMANDRIKYIDETSTFDITADDCVDLLLGTPGTDVTLTVERGDEEFKLTITRERIKTRAVKGLHRDPAKPEAWDYFIDHEKAIGYIRLTQFTPGCSLEVANALVAMGADQGKLKGLVLDLRYNPGGLLSEAEAIADLFLKDGVIVSTRGRTIPERVTRARDAGTLPPMAIAILINEQSASASEVLAGALVENNAAITVGTRTYGKGSVQSLHNIPGGNGSELKITEQAYYLPTGRSIQRKDDSAQWGVDPSAGFFVPMTDEQIIAMFEVRRAEEILRAAGKADEAANWDSPSWIIEHVKDPQFTAAYRAVEGKVTTGEWVHTGEEGSPEQQSQIAELKRTRELQMRLERELERTDRRLAALEAGKDPGAGAMKDLFPDDAPIKGGTVEIKDKDGNVVATLRITGSNLERWLLDADVEAVIAPSMTTPAEAPVEHIQPGAGSPLPKGEDAPTDTKAP
jgi:carboxyl-terminal processing protease